MSKLRAIIAVAFAALSFSIARADTYSYVGQVFTTISIASSGPVPLGSSIFQATDRVTGTLGVSGGLAPNLVNAAINVAGGSGNTIALSGGIRTLSSTIFLDIAEIHVSTDALGDIIAWSVILNRHASPDFMADTGMNFTYQISLSSLGDSAINNDACLGAPPGSVSRCGDAWSLNQSASNNLAGTWVRTVPEPSTWWLMILAFAGLCLAVKARNSLALGRQA